MDRGYIVLIIFAISLFGFLYYIGIIFKEVTNQFSIKKESLEKNIGESVIVNKDTLIIVHYKYQTGEYLMEDGQYINEKIILFKLNKK